jgi:hypothetical protein
MLVYLRGIFTYLTLNTITPLFTSHTIVQKNLFGYGCKGYEEKQKMRSNNWASRIKWWNLKGEK